MVVDKEKKRTLIFTYGTLKRGFSNHFLIEQMMPTNDVVYIGDFKTLEKLPLVCGPYKVPFLLNFPNSGNTVLGELYSVSDRSLSRMDELEGITRGHYERLPIKLVPSTAENTEDDTVVTVAEAYYGHRSYAEDLWRRNGEKGFSEYTAKEAQGYVYRKDRPQNLTFLQQIQTFVSSGSSPL